MSDENGWRRCGPCKKMIPYNSTYYICNVSSCKKHVFCSHNCWRAHVPLMRHKDAWAEEEKSPATKEAALAEAPAIPTKRIVANQPAPDSANKHQQSDAPKDILIVASKLKNYIKSKSQLNTSAQVMDILSDIVRDHCDAAIEVAKRDGRKTVMDRDFVR